MTIPYTPDNHTKMLRVADDLQGTCGSLRYALTKHFGGDGGGVVVFDIELLLQVEDFDIELLQVLDCQVMECEGCQWWCDTGELNDDLYCSDCAPYEDDE